MLSAVPDRTVGDCATLASFSYDRPLYNKLRATRDDRIGAIMTAYERGEGEPVSEVIARLEQGESL